MADRLSASHLTIRLLRLPTRASLAAAHGVSTEAFRMLTIVGVHTDGDLETTAGWGECSALNAPGYTHEWAEGAFDLLRSGQPVDAQEHPMAASAVEMALLDADLKAAGESLADRLGTAGKSAPAGGVVGLGPLPHVLDQVDELVESGYRRVKCKIAPGRIVVPIEAIRSSFPDIELHIDANASLRAEDIPALLRLRDLGVTAVEQPFAVHDVASASRLVADSDLAVVADEAVETVSDIDLLATDRAATAVVIKPARLGGIANALAALDAATLHGMQASLGGMLESGLGRHVLAAMAPLDAFTLIGDLSPAKRWLADDPFADISLRRGQVAAPKRPGIAGDPAQSKLERYTVRRAVVSLPPALR